MLNFYVRNLYSLSIKSPISLRLLYQQEYCEQLKKSMQGRFKSNTWIVDNVQNKLISHRKKSHELSAINKEINIITQSIRKLMEEKTQISQLAQKSQAKELLIAAKRKQEAKTAQIMQIKKNVQALLLQIGNLIDPEVVISMNEEDGKVISSFSGSGTSSTVPYKQICQKFELVDFKRGQKVQGHRGYFMKGNALKLALALSCYAVDFLEQKGYKPYYSPVFIQNKLLADSCQLKSIEKDIYTLKDQDMSLIATSEQSLCALFSGETLLQSNLPIRLCGYSSCFRKQAGAHGTNIHGLFRVHQFQKVEQFIISHPSKSKQEMDRMLQVAEEFYQSLKIPYKVIDMVSGDLNDATARKYDLLGYYPSRGCYQELVSISNCTDYQARMLKVVYRNKDKMLAYPHFLNGTLIAVQRAITCMLQNWYKDNQKGAILQVPQALQNYTHCSQLS